MPKPGWEHLILMKAYPLPNPDRDLPFVIIITLGLSTSSTLVYFSGGFHALSRPVHCVHIHVVSQVQFQLESAFPCTIGLLMVSAKRVDYCVS